MGCAFCVQLRHSRFGHFSPGKIVTPYYELSTTRKPKKSWNLGSFERLPVEDFRKRLDVLPSAKKPGKMKIRWAKDGLPGDIQDVHGQAGTDHATFQMASQFNCLEYSVPLSIH